MAQPISEAISFDLCSVSLLLGKRETTGGSSAVADPISIKTLEV
jgi:hypothetical protein